MPPTIQDSRAERLAQGVLAGDRAGIRAALGRVRMVIGLAPELAGSRHGQIGLVTAANILTRLNALAPGLSLHVPAQARVLPGVPLLAAGLPLGESLVGLCRRLASLSPTGLSRRLADDGEAFDIGLFVGRQTLPARRAVTVGADRWLALLNADGRELPLDARDGNPMGALLAAALGSAEVVKHAWLPFQARIGAIEPVEGTLTMSAYDLSVDPVSPVNPPIARDARIGHACVFGLGATGSACLFALSCMPGWRGSADLVDPDRIESSNEERLFTSVEPGDIGRPKAIHALGFLSRAAGGVRAFGYSCRFEQFVEGARDRLGYVLCGLDSAAARRALQLELPTIVSNGGTEGTVWSFSRHDARCRDEACLLDLHPAPGSAFNPQQALAEALGVGVEAVRTWQRTGRPPDAAVPARGPEALPGARLLTALPYARAVAHVCSTIRPVADAPAATISFVSVLPALAMVSDLLKRRLYGWQPGPDEPNVFRFDALRHPARGRRMRILAGPNCLCQSPRYRQAAARRCAQREHGPLRVFAAPAACRPVVRAPPPQPGRPLAVPRPPQPQAGRALPLAAGQGPPRPGGRRQWLGWMAAVLLGALALAVYLAGLGGEAVLLGRTASWLGDPCKPWQFWRMARAASLTSVRPMRDLCIAAAAASPFVVHWLLLAVTGPMLRCALRLHAAAIPAGGRAGNNGRGVLLCVLALGPQPLTWTGAIAALALLGRLTREMPFGGVLPVLLGMSCCLWVPFLMYIASAVPCRLTAAALREPPAVRPGPPAAGLRARPARPRPARTG